MTFIDEIDIYVSSGNGGNGSISFSHTKNNKKYDGGNGGNGGNVYIIGNKNDLTLNKIKFKIKYKAEDGFNGENNSKKGKNGKNLYITVPIGTIIYDNERKIYLGEILKHNENILIAKGGNAGIGNKIFKKNIQKNINVGKSGEIKFLHLKLHLLADIGLFGYPNTGKSLFLNTCTHAKSKVENYIFTTINPNLGAILYYKKKNIILADIPGIIKKASLGIGLGFNFLKHLLKTKLLLHIYDATQIKTNFNFFKHVIILNNELKKFDNILYKKEKWLVINKIDLIKTLKYIPCIKKYNYTNIFFISLKKKIGIKKILFNIIEYYIKKL